MKYEIDFIGVKEKQCKKDADAIIVKWKKDLETKIVIYDGGYEAHSKEIVSILEKYSFEENKKYVDSIIISHPDEDHISGLKYIINNITVKKIYMNRPWLYIDEISRKQTDYSKKEIERRLKEEYSCLYEIEELAIKNGIEIKNVFQGDIIENNLLVLSPSKEFFIEMLSTSKKTWQNSKFSTYNSIREKLFNLIESWNNEKLKEDVYTSEENETSTIIYGNMGNQKFLLVGDAGIRALKNANNYANLNSISIKNDVNILQIPHHGSRHNVSTSLLNEIIGDIVDENESCNKTAFALAAENSEHPYQMVLNAYIRRGVKTYVTKGATIHHNNNMPKRNGWTAIEKEKFSKNVEEWDN